ncbi:MAG: tRNA (adenosine(37)-N6)-dimethylallyltransferase MiaA [Patescibacteria group bacterium]
MKKPKVIAIVGPTSSGKTSLSIAIAKTFNGEVISADSRQVYTKMDIGTGKVAEKEMAGVPHHLIDIVDPMTVYTGADFKRDATLSLDDILKRKRLPIIVGGTFFYIELLRGTMQVAPVPPDPIFRASLDIYDNMQLLEILKAKDAHRAVSIDSDNRRRLVRSLEIINKLGVVPEPVKVESEYDWLILGLNVEKKILHQNIHARLQERFEAGMIDEVKGLHAAGITYDRLDSFGLEYRYIARYLQGELSESQMKNELETKIRQFAKRQLTWLKRDSEVEWFEPKNQEVILDRVKAFLQ